MMVGLPLSLLNPHPAPTGFSYSWNPPGRDFRSCGHGTGYGDSRCLPPPGGRPLSTQSRTPIRILRWAVRSARPGHVCFQPEARSTGILDQDVEANLMRPGVTLVEAGSSLLRRLQRRRGRLDARSWDRDGNCVNPAIPEGFRRFPALENPVRADGQVLLRGSPLRQRSPPSTRLMQRELRHREGVTSAHIDIIGIPAAEHSPDGGPGALSRSERESDVNGI
jgi:hypothetical protein